MFALRAVIKYRHTSVKILNSARQDYHLPQVLKARFLSSEKKNKIMVDPKRVVSYDDMLKVIHQPEKVIIDVRNPDEVHNTGKIPSSINIPLGNVQNVLASMSEEEFKRQYQRSKPSSSDELIFYCQSGRRSSEALDKALKLGYSNSKTYLGSWNDWSSRQK
ncbi:rhodanese domain-containing protein CG4456 isoform X3 [Manduca sexta]|uniref:rhodanese domain-containing protein CG4456 isoform X3 n=1 Tax=Manduca sexta TaxID=7130 RepID=UPI0011835721|nr:rhodanese domain-containing protein CG4456 isoform X3 [Manduca sexta]